MVRSWIRLPAGAGGIDHLFFQRRNALEGVTNSRELSKKAGRVEDSGKAGRHPLLAEPNGRRRVFKSRAGTARVRPDRYQTALPSSHLYWLPYRCEPLSMNENDAGTRTDVLV